MSRQLLGALLLLAAPTLISEAAAADFTFRRVGVPAPDAIKRLTVQIALQESRGSALSAPESDRAEDPAGVNARGHSASGNGLPHGGFSDFWQRLPREPGPGRLSQAADLLHVPAINAPLGRLANRYGAIIAEATERTAVSPALILAVMMVESSGRVGAISPAGAAGLMQLMPATAERFGVTDRLDPRQSVQGGVRYLDWLLREFDGDVILALAGYNAGENAVKRHGGVPPYRETLAYVPKVVAAWSAARDLCGGDAPPVCDLARVASAR